jgi:hypothetical protein
LRLDTAKFLRRELKHKVSRKPIPVPRNGLVQRTHFHTVKSRDIGIKQHFFASNEEDQRRYVFRYWNY